MRRSADNADHGMQRHKFSSESFTSVQAMPRMNSCDQAGDLLGTRRGFAPPSLVFESSILISCSLLQLIGSLKPLLFTRQGSPGNFWISFLWPLGCGCMEKATSSQAVIRTGCPESGSKTAATTLQRSDVSPSHPLCMAGTHQPKHYIGVTCAPPANLASST